MALKVVSMEELKLQVLFEPGRTGGSVAEVCRRHGISRETFYLYRRRYLEDGIAGLTPRSRRPRASPAQIDPALEAAICELRRLHPRFGARRIRAELERAGIAAPAISTVHQALRRNLLVFPQPPRKPKARKRFERERSNDLWQIDATRVALRGEQEAWIVDCLDDHARFCLAAHACQTPTGEDAWACFVKAAAAYGLPRQVLSDNGAIFTGRTLGHEVAFERRLADIRVKLITSAPAHPQTLGKLERFHRTLKEWLADEGPAADLAELQTLLDRFRLHYNEERPHQGIADRTPAERYLTGWAETGASKAPASALRREPRYPPYALVRRVGPNGVLGFRRKRINVGSRYRGALVRILEEGKLIHVYLGDEHLRSLAPDPNETYQRLGRRRSEEVTIRP